MLSDEKILITTRVLTWATATSATCRPTSPTCCTLAADQSGGHDYDRAIRVDAEGTGPLLRRALDLPVTIARMNASYGDNGGLPANHLAAALADDPVITRWDPCVYSPIHEDDICLQTEGLLQAASVPATIVNGAGDEQVSVQQWAALMAEELGRDIEVQVGTSPTPSAAPSPTTPSAWRSPAPAPSPGRTASAA